MDHDTQPSTYTAMSLPELTDDVCDARLRVTHLLAPSGFGGLERVVSGIAASSAQYLEQVHVALTLAPGDTVPHWADELSLKGVEVIPIFVKGRAYLQEQSLVRSVLLRTNTHVVHTHGYRPDVLHAPVARRLQIPTISTVHGFTRRALKGRAYEWFQRRSLRRFDAVVAVSRPLHAELTLNGVPQSRLHLIPNGLVLGATIPFQRVESRQKLRLPADDLTVGWVGRVSPEKGLDVMLLAFSKMRIRNVRLAVVGDGPDLDRCRAITTRLGLASRVSFLGAVPDASRYMAAFDILALSSRTEGTPMVLLEAANAGIPIVATDVGGVADMLGRDSAVLVEPQNPSGLASAIQRVLADIGGATQRATILRDRIRTTHDTLSWTGRYCALYATISPLAH